MHRIPRQALPTGAAALRPRRAPQQAFRRLLSSSAAVRQVHPRGAYYDVLITDPPPYASHATAPTSAKVATKETVASSSKGTPIKATTKPAPPASSASSASPAPAPPPPKAEAAAPPAPEQQTVQQRAKIVFGSRLVGPAERANRLAELRQRSRRIAGVLVPPKPDEPDNCCMSGCVNCVWDRFRDEMEAWAAASAEASRRLRAQEAAGSSSSSNVGGGASPVSMDDDGGGSVTNWSPEALTASTAMPTMSSGWAEELYKDVPVGIREFMRQEKRLKLKHMQEGTIGG